MAQKDTRASFFGVVFYFILFSQEACNFKIIIFYCIFSRIFYLDGVSECNIFLSELECGELHGYTYNN